MPQYACHITPLPLSNLHIEGGAVSSIRASSQSGAGAAGIAAGGGAGAGAGEAATSCVARCQQRWQLKGSQWRGLLYTKATSHCPGAHICQASQDRESQGTVFHSTGGGGSYQW